MKKFFLVTIFMFSAVGALYLQLVFFPKDTSSVVGTNTESLWDESGGLGQNIGAQYQDIKEKFFSLKNEVEKNRHPERLTAEEIEALKVKLMQKMDSKTTEKLAEQFKAIGTRIPAGWTYRLSATEKGLTSDMVAKIMLSGNRGCERCTGQEPCDRPVSLTSKKVLEFYPRDLQNTVEQKLERYNANVIGGMCRKIGLFTTEDYFIIDGCSNNFNCEDTEDLDTALRDYFQPQPNVSAL